MKGWLGACGESPPLGARPVPQTRPLCFPGAQAVGLQPPRASKPGERRSSPRGPHSAITPNSLAGTEQCGLQRQLRPRDAPGLPKAGLLLAPRGAALPHFLLETLLEAAPHSSVCCPTAAEPSLHSWALNTCSHTSSHRGFLRRTKKTLPRLYKPQVLKELCEGRRTVGLVS